MGRGSYHQRFGSVALALTAVTVTGLSYIGLPVLLGYLIAINLTTFCFYAYDKAIAGQTDTTRVPESVLQTLALLGGSPAALLAQETLRHKTAKQSFQRVFWLILIVQIGLLVWWFLRPTADAAT